ncbi:uncharacterized protein LOC144123481 [Amblyomma americanum]
MLLISSTEEPTTTTTTTTTTTATPLYCQITAPHKGEVASIHPDTVLPPDGLCDIMILWISQYSSGVYEESAYKFFKRLNLTATFLFTLSWSGSPNATLNLVRATGFSAEANKLYHEVNCRGFGIKSDFPDITVDAGLLPIFKELSVVLQNVGYPKTETITFLMFRVRGTLQKTDQVTIQKMSPYLGLLVFMAWLEISKDKVVHCIASWNKLGLPDPYAMSFENAIESIVSLPDGSTKYAIALSLIALQYNGVNISPIAKANEGFVVGMPYSNFKTSENFPDICKHVLPSGKLTPMGHYNDTAACITHFNPKSNPPAAFSFETAESIQVKMTRTRAMLAKLRKRNVSWAVGHVSKNLSPEECGGFAHRLKKIREINDTPMKEI